MTANSPSLASTTEIGSLGVMHLKRLWSSGLAIRNGHVIDRQDEIDLDRTLLNALGLGLQQTISYLFAAAPTFDDFETWIASQVGTPSAFQVARLNASITKTDHSDDVKRWLGEIETAPPVLTESDLAFWEEQGYVVLKDAVSPNELLSAEQAIWEHLNADALNSQSWYGTAEDRHGIMVELIQHPSLDAIRRGKRIHKAFAQLWETADLWPTADRCGFHPPQRDDHPFPGPDLHWDINFERPQFGTQGILYLTDTPAEQGALTLVPGFHRRLSDWLDSLPPGADPQAQDLHELGSLPIAGKAGDLIIWHQMLPHGSRPNLGKRPRLVHYINLLPCPSMGTE